MPGADDDQRPELARLAERILAQEVRDFTTLSTAAVQAARDPGPESLWGLDQAAAGGNGGAQGALRTPRSRFRDGSSRCTTTPRSCSYC